MLSYGINSTFGPSYSRLFFMSHSQDIRGLALESIAVNPYWNIKNNNDMIIMVIFIVVFTNITFLTYTQTGSITENK